MIAELLAKNPGPRIATDMRVFFAAEEYTHFGKGQKPVLRRMVIDP